MSTADPSPSATDAGVGVGVDVDVDDWDDHWARYQSSARANPAQAYRRRLVFDLLDRGTPPHRILDIGSGQGDLLLEARRRWPRAELAGVELSAAGVAAARAKVPAATFEQRDLLVAGRPGAALAGWATHGVCSEVLEHVEEPEALLAASAAYVTSGGTIVVTVPGGDMSAFDRHIGHRTHYTPDTLADVVERAGLSVGRVQQAGFPFFNAYRKMVIMRGAKLIDDVDESEGQPLPLSARTAMRAFDRAFRYNRPDTRWGTQLVATALVA